MNKLHRHSRAPLARRPEESGSTQTCASAPATQRICPSVFSADKALGYAVGLKPVVNDPALLEKVELAEQTCPTRAIELTPVE